MFLQWISVLFEKQILGLFFSLFGAFCLLYEQIKSGAACIRQEGDNKGLKESRKKWKNKIPIWVAEQFGSKNILYTEEIIVDKYSANFWGFVILMVGFSLQVIGH